MLIKRKLEERSLEYFVWLTQLISSTWLCSLRKTHFFPAKQKIHKANPFMKIYRIWTCLVLPWREWNWYRANLYFPSFLFSINPNGCIRWEPFNNLSLSEANLVSPAMTTNLYLCLFSSRYLEQNTYKI